MIDAAEIETIVLTSSAALLAELQGVLSRDKFAGQLAKRGLTGQEVFDGYAALVTIVTAAVIPPTIQRDPADDQVLAAALAAQVQLIVSGDAHLLDLKSSRGIEIVTAATAVERMDSTHGTTARQGPRSQRR